VILWGRLRAEPTHSISILPTQVDSSTPVASSGAIFDGMSTLRCGACLPISILFLLEIVFP